MKCPFISNLVLNSMDSNALLLQECLGSDCQVWDADNSQCGALVSNAIKKPADEHDHLIQQLETVLGKGSERDANHSLLKYLIDIVGKNSDLLGTDHTLLKLFKHKHDSHDHGQRHTCSTIPAGCGAGIGRGMGDMLPMGLIQEQLNNEDHDNNGLIWMKDFKFDDADEEVPAIIKNFLAGTCIDDSAITNVLTWAEYKATVS